MKMSETRALQNQRALTRLTKTLPADFPAPALIHALARRWTPLNRLAVRVGLHVALIRIRIPGARKHF